jgi:hypothetical protein
MSWGKGVMQLRFFLTLVVVLTGALFHRVGVANDQKKLSLAPVPPAGGLKQAEVGRNGVTLPGMDLEVSLSRKGAWGQVEYFSAMLEAPDSVLEISMPTSFQTRWIFDGKSEEWVEGFLKERELPMMLEKRLLDRAIWYSTRSEVTISPPVEVLRELPSKARGAIYAMLGESDRNPDQLEPEVIYGASVDDWLKDDGLREELVAFVRACAYSRGGANVFADKLALYSICNSDQERMKARRAMSRNPTIVAKLLLESGTPDFLSAYWGSGFRLKDTMPFLRSMSRTRGVDKLDIIHLLPSAMRRILYTFPNPAATRSGYLPDCHWTSLNFFNVEPLERLADPVQGSAYVHEHFEQVGGPYRLGDVLFLAHPETGAAFHSCTYICDDIVMTKNGRSPIQPWVLMKLDQVKLLYGLHFQTEVRGFRRKGIN